MSSGSISPRRFEDDFLLLRQEGADLVVARAQRVAFRRLPCGVAAHQVAGAAQAEAARPMKPLGRMCAARMLRTAPASRRRIARAGRAGR